MADINSQLPVKLSDGTLTASLRDTGSNDSLNVAVVDASGNQITDFSGGTQYTEDEASAGGESLTLAGVVRRDTAASSAGTDGDFATLNTDATGHLWTHDSASEALLTTIDADTSALAGAVAGTEVQVDVVSSALPTGASTAANQTTIIGHLDGVEGLLTTIDGDTSTLAGAVSGTEMQVDVVTSALPTGAATAANQLPDGHAVTVDNTEAEAIPVYITGGAVSGTEVNNYDTSSAVAASAADNHDYSVTGGTFLLKQITFAASGKMKVELQVGPVATLASKGVWFVSSANPNFAITFAQPIEVPVTDTGTVRLIRTNLEASAMDVYSTIIGSQLA